MNISKINAAAIRHSIEVRGQLEGNPNHNQHIIDFCSYADAVSKGEADDVRQGIPATVQQEVQKQMQSNKV